MSSLVGTLITAAVLIGLVWFFLTRTVIGRGFSVPLRTMFRTPETAEYPERPRPVAPRFHGRHQLNRYADGLEKCIGCELCAWACPADAIYVQGANNTRDARYSPGERYAEDYQISYARCIFCGLCIEACPTRALTMTHEYRMSSDDRFEGLVYTKDQLLAPAPPDGHDTPHTDDEVRERAFNYYGGPAVTPPTVHGGHYEQASPAPAKRMGQVRPDGALPSTDEVPDDPAFVGHPSEETTSSGGASRPRTLGGG